MKQITSLKKEQEDVRKELDEINVIHEYKYLKIKINEKGIQQHDYVRHFAGKSERN